MKKQANEPKSQGITYGKPLQLSSTKLSSVDKLESMTVLKGCCVQGCCRVEIPKP